MSQALKPLTFREFPFAGEDPRFTPVHPVTPLTDAEQNRLIKLLDSHLISHEQALLEMILHARALETRA